MVDPPSGGAPEQAPRWDLTGTEGCDDGIRVFSVASMFSGYMDIYRRKEGIGGAKGGPRGWGRALDPRGHLVASLTSTPSLLDCVCSKNNSPKGFIPSGLRLISLFSETLK